MVSWYRRFCLSNYFRILTIRVADQLHFNADPFPLFALMRILIRIRFLMKVIGLCDPRSTSPPRPSLAPLESLRLLNFDFNANLDLRMQPFSPMRIHGPDPHYLADPDPQMGPADPDRIYFNQK